MAFYLTRRNHLPTTKTPVAKLDHRAVVWLCDDLKRLAPTSERLYLQAILKFYKYLADDEMSAVHQRVMENRRRTTESTTQ